MGKRRTKTSYAGIGEHGAMRQYEREEPARASAERTQKEMRDLDVSTRRAQEDLRLRDAELSGADTRADRLKMDAQRMREDADLRAMDIKSRAAADQRKISAISRQAQQDRNRQRLVQRRRGRR